MELVIRKILTLVDEVLVDGGKPVAPVKKIAVAAVVIKNPHAGQYVEDLFPMIDTLAPELGKLLATRVTEALGGKVEAYGKAAIVGTAGEVEHGSALIHTLKFGNYFRDAAQATTLLPAVEKVAPAGTIFDIPLKHVTAEKTRSHYQSYTVQVPGAPLPDEILVALVATNSGRPHARIGDLSQEAHLLNR